MVVDRRSALELQLVDGHPGALSAERAVEPVVGTARQDDDKRREIDARRSAPEVDRRFLALGAGDRLDGGRADDLVIDLVPAPEGHAPPSDDRVAAIEGRCYSRITQLEAAHGRYWGQSSGGPPMHPRATVPTVGAWASSRRDAGTLASCSPSPASASDCSSRLVWRRVRPRLARCRHEPYRLVYTG